MEREQGVLQVTARLPLGPTRVVEVPVASKVRLFAHQIVSDDA